VLNQVKRVWPFVISALFGFILAAIIFFPRAYSSNQSVYRVLQTKLRDLNQILGYLNHFYFDSIDMDKIMDGAFFGLMEKLDPHSTYIPAKEQETIDEVFKGKFQGIGIEFDILNGFITVISPVPDSPSQIVGLMSGDKITAIDGEDAYKITKDEVFKKLRGKKGTKVVVTINRIGKPKPFDVMIIRDDIPIYSVGAATMIDDETGYIFLRRFSATTKEEVTASLDKLINKGMKRLLFDLRGNSGGYLEQAAAIVDQFITTKDTLVYTIGKVKESNQVFMGSAEVGHSNFSLIILINRGSASAAEIVSGAVQDLDRGLVIGETSFGKGLVQRQLPLESGAAVRVTIARYFTPSGRLIQRPYEDGNELSYYKELYAKDRESVIDSLKELRPKYLTKSGRTVYGGGGITPDIYIPFKSSVNNETGKVLRNPKRPFFNFASEYANKNRNNFNSFDNFRDNWKVSNSLYSDFLNHLETDSIFVSQDSLRLNSGFIHNRIKSEIADAIWGKDEGANIRLKLDNQIIEALKYFNEANAFIKSLN
jgi:carboxyl-terminal processing protease